jgi:hypothetical protein
MTAKQVQIRRDSSTNLNAAVPATGELGYDSTNKRVRVGDGSTSGGIILPNSIDIQGQNFLSADASGTNTITMTVAPVPTAYVKYQRFVFKASASNTGSATINVNSLGAKTIKKRTTSGVAALTGGEIQIGGVYAVVYDGTDMQLEDHTVATGTSDFVEIATLTASTSSTLDFTSSHFDNATYSGYYFEINKLLHSANSNLWIRFSTDGGSTFQAASSSYKWRHTRSVDATDTTVVDTSATERQRIEAAVSGGAAPRFTGEFDLLGAPNTGNNDTVCKWFLTDTGSGGIAFTNGWGGKNDSAFPSADVDGLRFLPSTGNFTSGTVTMYGRK